MTSFSRILGQSWKVKFHKVKLLKFQSFDFDLKFLWNWSFFHYEKIMRFKKVFSSLELEEEGRGIIMGVSRLLLLGPFYTIQTIPWANILHPSVQEIFFTTVRILYFCLGWVEILMTPLMYFQYKSKSTTILKETRLAQLASENELTLAKLIFLR